MDNQSLQGPKESALGAVGLPYAWLREVQVVLCFFVESVPGVVQHPSPTGPNPALPSLSRWTGSTSADQCGETVWDVLDLPCFRPPGKRVRRTEAPGLLLMQADSSPGSVLLHPCRHVVALASVRGHCRIQAQLGVSHCRADPSASVEPRGGPGLAHGTVSQAEVLSIFHKQIKIKQNTKIWRKFRAMLPWGYVKELGF